MINLKSVTWKTWLGLAILIFLLIIIFGKCNTDRPIKTVEVIMPDKTAIKERDAYRDTVEYYRSQIATSKKEKESTDRLLNNANKQLKGLISKYNEAVLAQNVPEIRVTCDSIVLENTQLFEQIGQYQTDMNELVDYYELALKASDSAAIKSNYLLIRANAAAQQVTADYNALVKSNNKNLKKAKRNKGLNRVLAGALVVVSGILIVK